MGIRLKSEAVPAAVNLFKLFLLHKPLFLKKNGKVQKSEVSQKTCQAKQFLEIKLRDKVDGGCAIVGYPFSFFSLTLLNNENFCIVEWW